MFSSIILMILFLVLAFATKDEMTRKLMVSLSIILGVCAIRLVNNEITTFNEDEID